MANASPESITRRLITGFHDQLNSVHIPRGLSYGVGVLACTAAFLAAGPELAESDGQAAAAPAPTYTQQPGARLGRMIGYTDITVKGISRGMIEDELQDFYTHSACFRSMTPEEYEHELRSKFENDPGTGNAIFYDLTGSDYLDRKYLSRFDYTLKHTIVPICNQQSVEAVQTVSFDRDGDIETQMINASRDTGCSNVDPEYLALRAKANSPGAFTKYRWGSSVLEIGSWKVNFDGNGFIDIYDTKTTVDVPYCNRVKVSNPPKNVKIKVLDSKVTLPGGSGNRGKSPSPSQNPYNNLKSVCNFNRSDYRAICRQLARPGLPDKIYIKIYPDMGAPTSKFLKFCTTAARDLKKTTIRASVNSCDYPE